MLPMPVAQPTYENGTSGQLAATWHLSVLDAGQPRGDSGRQLASAQVWKNAPLLARSSWNTPRLRETQWYVSLGLHPARGEELQQFLFGIRGAVPVAGDFNGDGRTDLGVFYRGEWFIDINGNGLWDESDLWAHLGGPEDQPVVGDWNGDGKDDIGIFGPQWAGDERALAREPGLPDFHNQPKVVAKNLPPREVEATDGVRMLLLKREGAPRADLIDHVFRFGRQGDIPIAGDWDGDGIDTIGIFREGRWILDVNGDGKASGPEPPIQYGQAGDQPVVGDFDGDGIDEIGVYRNGVWYVDTNHNHVLDASDQMIELGGPGKKPVVGDWNADGTSEPGLFAE
ncbi:MAG TPA: VCBS repeat-containing protein [Pirellulaceae bacterium]|nr:VCBS repeat-containing protein [Pirellulaceae bacterium]